MRSPLRSKMELLLNETCKTSRLGIAAKFKMHLIGILIKLNRISEINACKFPQEFYKIMKN